MTVELYGYDAGLSGRLQHHGVKGMHWGVRKKVKSVYRDGAAKPRAKLAGAVENFHEGKTSHKLLNVQGAYRKKAYHLIDDHTSGPNRGILAREVNLNAKMVRNQIKRGERQTSEILRGKYNLNAVERDIKENVHDIHKGSIAGRAYDHLSTGKRKKIRDAGQAAAHHGHRAARAILGSE